MVDRLVKEDLCLYRRSALDSSSSSDETVVDLPYGRNTGIPLYFPGKM